MKNPHSEFFDKLKRDGAKSCLHIGFGISEKNGIVVNCGYAVFSSIFGKSLAHSLHGKRKALLYALC